MKALSVRHPWTWLILNTDKDLENRTWPTNVRGRVLLHAAKGVTRDEWLAGMLYAAHIAKVPADTLRQANFDSVQRGGFVGSVEIVDCVTASSSRWYMGAYGFVLRDVRPMPFVPYKGALNFFHVPDYVLESAGVDLSLHRK